MFKKKESYSPAKISQDQVSELTFLIARMQRNSDQVEQNILRAEDLQAADKQNELKNLPLRHQKENADNLAEAEGLLKDLFLDVDKVKRLHHPQAQEIESDVSNLHDRWFKDCATYRDLYEQVDDVNPRTKIDWGQLLTEKQKQLNSAKYGPNLSDVEKQIAAHNILHNEIESYKSQQKDSAYERQYSNLLDSSLARRNNLASLYDYMTSCNRELAFLSDQQDKIASRDWSDRMVDAPTVRMEYERFKNSGLLTHESEVTRLQEERENLVDDGHPASTIIKSLNEKVQSEWHRFLNLCICQETHLDNVEDYKRYQLDMETFSESLKRINSTLDSELLENMSTLEKQMHIEGEERAVQRNEQRLSDLKELSNTIAPIHLRRLHPAKPVNVVSLCDWTTDKTSMQRGDRFTLKSNDNEETWEVQTSNGLTKAVPSVCLLILPPDKDAIARVESLGAQLEDLKRKRAALLVPVTRKTYTQPVNSSSPQDRPGANDLSTRLDKVMEGLLRAEKDIQNRIRAPLDRRSPKYDLSKRIDDHEKTVLVLNHLEAEKASIQREMQPLLSQTPLGPVTSTLPTKLSAINNKFDNVTALSGNYKKKANAAMFLENQINKVDTSLSGFEQQLVKTDVISDEPDSVQTRTRQLQTLRKDVTDKKDDIHKLDRDFENTAQLCSSLQKSFHEYCPDIRRQEADVKRLKNRYANINNQLLERSTLMQDIGNKNQDFESTVKSLNAFLINMPNNKINPYDSLAQINAKQNSQKRVMEDIKRKSDEVDRVVVLSEDLQKLLNEHDRITQKYHNTLNTSENHDNLDSSDLIDSVQQKERDVLNLYSEVSAENEQLLHQMFLAKNIMNKNEEVVSQVVVKQQMQMQSQQRSLDEVNGLKKDLEAEVSRRLYAENDLETYRKRLQSLRSRRGVERLEEKEIVQYYRDPKLESDLESLKRRVGEESSKRTSTHTEIDVLKQKTARLERELASIEPKMVTKVVTEIERDPQLDKDAERIRLEIQRLREEITSRKSETLHLQTEIRTLEQKKPTIRQRVVKKEVIKLEKDPIMLKSVHTFQNEIADEQLRVKALNDDIFETRSKINTLERIIPTVQPKIITKEVKRVEQDPELFSESKRLHTSLNEEMKETNILLKELASLRLQYTELEKRKPKVEVKEIINEIYRVHPDTELELKRLRRELQQSGHLRTDVEREITGITVELNTLRNQKPKVEYKEVTQEVIKVERSPEMAREIQRLNDQLTLLRNKYDTIQNKVYILCKDRDEVQAEKSKVRTEIVNKEIVRYENDPLLEKEADRLRRDVREVTQQRRHVEEAVYDLQNKYLLLERQKPEEKIVVQEVVRLQKDPRQIVEHERLQRDLDLEAKARMRLELELNELRALVLEKERSLSGVDRQKKIIVETELRQIRSRILELESAPPPVEEKIVIEEVLKVERDPKLDMLIHSSRVDMENEENNISRLQRDITNLKIRLDILKKEKSVEKLIYKEVIRVEKDHAVEAERDNLREQMTQAKNARRDLEDEIQRLNARLTRLHTSKTTTSQEETNLTQTRDSLQREKDLLLEELRRLERERETTTITFQHESKLLSERNQVNRQKNIQLESDIQRLERDILDEKEIINKRDITIMELQSTLKTEDHSETHTRETNVSTRITILDPDTGKDMSPYDAYVAGVIDKNQYMHFQELECNWEEITTKGPYGDTSVLQDRKSGKQYSISDALKDGRLTQYDLQCYKDGKMSISEFALLVAGEKKPKPFRSSFSTSTPDLSSVDGITSPTRSSYNSNSLYSRSYSNDSLNTLHTTPMNTNSGDENFPISGVIDVTTNSRMSVRSALTRKLIDFDTAQRLLEAQAATGGIVDLSKKDRYSVHKAAQYGLIDKSQMHQLLNAQKAFTGVEDPVTKDRLSVGQAAQKGWIPQENAMWYLETQYLTGGLVNPNKPGRITVEEAVHTDMIDNLTAKELQDEGTHLKFLVDPITKEKITLKEAMLRCKKDQTTGLLLLPAASNDADSAPSYSKYNFSSSLSRV